jgi:hypothetical protein
MAGNIVPNWHSFEKLMSYLRASVRRKHVIQDPKLENDDFGPSEVRATSGQHLGGHYFGPSGVRAPAVST